MDRIAKQAGAGGKRKVRIGMTSHLSSLADCGRRISELSECLLSGAPLDYSASLIRDQFDASAVAIQLEGRAHPARRLHVFDFRTQPVLPELTCEDRLSTLSQQCHSRHAVSCSDNDGSRCALWIFRSQDRGDFAREDDALCEIFVAQLRRGIELSARLTDSEIERALYSHVMDRLSVGVVVLDSSGRVLKCSPGAKTALSRRDGLQVQAGRLRAATQREDAQLQAAIRAAAESSASGEAPVTKALNVSRSERIRGLGIVVQTIGRNARAPGCAAAVAVYLRDPEELAEVESDLVRQLFDLTPAEAAVARRLASGLSLEEVAAALDISRNTARAHLRSIFSKSGISRQTELVRLMLTSAAVLGQPARSAA